MSTLPTVSIDPTIFESCGDLALVGLVASEIDSDHVASVSPSLLGEAAHEVSQSYADVEDLASADPIVRWREAYRRQGLKASRFRSSIESLIRRAARGDSVSVSPLVDLYNGVSLKFRVPLGAVDLARLPSVDVRFRHARPDTDHFAPLGGEGKDFPLSANLPVYAAGNEVLCWGFNCRDSRLTALSPETRSVLFLTEVIDPSERGKAVEALTYLAATLEGGTSDLALGIADRHQPEWRPAYGASTVSTALASVFG